MGNNNITENKPKICIILGAGASFDVHGQGSVIKDGAWRPPLAKDIFDIQAHHNYFEILQLYPGAAHLAQLLSPKIASGKIGLEDALKSFAFHQDVRIRNNFKQIPAYIRDLIHISSTFTQIPSSYVQLTTELLANNPHNVLFLTLNYDMLLETALELLDSKYQFSEIARYISFYNMKLIKLHGSENWFSTIPHSSIPEINRNNWIKTISQVDPLVKTREKHIFIGNNIGNVIHATQRINEEICDLYPILTAPLAGKNINDSVCPKSHLDAAREFLKDCNKFLIIGCSGLDDDLIHLLNSSINPDIKPILNIVGSSHVEAVFNRFRKEIKVFNELNQDGAIIGSGFSSYLQSEGFKIFSLAK